MNLRFDGRVALVTGAGNGLGKAYALELARRGAAVVVNDLGGAAGGGGGDPKASSDVVEEIRSAGGRALANSESVENGAAIVAAAVEEFGRIDIVINNAGILRDVSFHKMSEEDWDCIYRVHLLGAMRVTRAAWPHMRAANYGRVLMTSSAAGIFGNFGQVNYSAMKLALHGMAQSLAIEGAPRSIHVNTIAPLAASRLAASVMSADVMTVLSHEFVTPLALWLVHENCPATAGLFEVGGGWIAALGWERTRGIAQRTGMTVESVEEAWSQIIDLTSSVRPRKVSDTLEQISAAAGVDISLIR